jgi:peptidyl-prolyl cis-trans isomerase D
MLDVMRKHSRSFIIYVLFGIIIAVFVINFGPQSAGCTAAASSAGKVEGNAITPKLLAYAFSVSGIHSQQVPEPEMVMLRGRVVDQLLFRELLAEDALKLGIRIPEKEIDDMVVKGRFLALGQPRPLIRDDDGKFDYELFSRYVRYSWGLTVKKFKDDQRRELLAEKFRDLFRSSVKASEEEVRAHFIQTSTQAKLDYVRFTPGEFRSQVAVDDAKVVAYAAQHADKVKQHYEDNKTAYQKLPKQARLQLITINAPESDARARAAAKKKAEGALKRLKAGEDFAKLARELSDDVETRASGGILGWFNEDSPPVREVARKEVPKLKDGEASQLLADKEGFIILRVLGRRQGDLTLEQAKGEIAEEMLREDEAVRLARQAAEGFLKRVKAGEKLADLFPEATDEEKEGEEEGDKPEGEKKAAEKDKPEGEKKAAEAPRFKLASTASFPRSAQNLVPGIGISAELMNDVFKLKTGEVAPTVYTVDRNVYLVAVKERTDPDWGDWNKRKSDLIEEYRLQKYVRALTTYAYTRCEAAYNNKEIALNQRALVTPGYAPPKGEPPLPAYAPCTSLKPENLE